MGGATRWVEAVRHSHDRLSGLVDGLEGAALTGPSACSEWSVAQVLSHLGSQAEIFTLFLDAGLSGSEPPGRDAFAPIWEQWDARSPQAQAADSIAGNEAFVERLEGVDGSALDGFSLEMFGRSMDAPDLLRMRLSEHALHTWDVAVAGDAGAEVAPEAVELLIDGIGETAGRAGKAPATPLRAILTTTSPTRIFQLTADESVAVEAGAPLDGEGPTVMLPAEALLRLVYGRLDDAHPAHGPIEADGVSLADLRAIFPGF
jgi:uncharacterized protein (TIGR03083 family)